MATYTKKLKTLAVHQMLDSEVVNIADTADNDMATRALNEFKRYETMHYETEEGGQKVTNAIPYHAVQYIEVREAEADTTKADPYGCDEGGSDTYTVTFDVSEVEGATPIEPMVVKKGESITLPPPKEPCEGNAWFVNGDLEQMPYNSGDTYTPTADVTLVGNC